jgi:plasmid stability protein
MQSNSFSTSTASITIRNLDPALKEKLRIRAAQHGHSMEAEARHILKASLAEDSHTRGQNLYERIHGRFASLGGVEIELPQREPAGEPPCFD